MPARCLAEGGQKHAFAAGDPGPSLAHGPPSTAVCRGLSFDSPLSPPSTAQAVSMIISKVTWRSHEPS